MAAMPQYYELSWAILSTIGIFNVLIGFMVIGIAGFSPVSMVPLIVSVATAVANGMCYYAFYADNPVNNTAVASVFADLMWLIQEAGLSFYSYAILVRVLQNRQRLVFLVLFWFIMANIGALRITIMATRLKSILAEPTDAPLQRLIDHLHVAYFSCIAAVECISAIFLLVTFNHARRISMRAAIQGGLFSYLMRSTEIRLAMLALVGLTRAVTYSFQNTVQSAEGVAGQLDRFAYTLECAFPVIMYIDILASRLVFAKGGRSHETSSHNKHADSNQRGTSSNHVQMYPVSGTGRRNDTATDRKSSDAASSQEHIIGSVFGARSEIEGGPGVHPIENGRVTPGFTGINKTVGFEISESRVEDMR